MIIHPIRCCCLPISELARFHFSYDYGAGVDEFLDRDCVGSGCGIEIVPCAVTVAGADAGDVVDVFYAEANAG